jgi:hypothetical protein
MAKIKERVQRHLLGERENVYAMPMHEVTPTKLANDPLLTVQLSEQQTARVAEIEATGPSTR